MCHDVKKFGRLHSGAKNVNSGCKPIRVPIPPLLCAGCVTLSKLVNGTETQFSHKVGKQLLLSGWVNPKGSHWYLKLISTPVWPWAESLAFLFHIYLFYLTVPGLTYGMQASLAAAHGLSSCSMWAQLPHGIYHLSSLIRDWTLVFCIWKVDS